MCKIDSDNESLSKSNQTNKMSNNGVNISNLIKTYTGAAGFSNDDAISELIDNSIDASADRIQITYDDISQTIYFADNGCGMEEKRLVECYTLYNHVAHDDEQRNGVFGIGSKAGLIKLSNGKRPSIVLTKIKNSSPEPIQMKTDWVTAIETGVYALYPHSASKTGCDLWDKYGLGTKGTLLCIMCDSEVYNELKSNIVKMCADIGIRYYRSIDNGLKITMVDGAEQVFSVKSNNPIGSVAESSHIKENKIETYKVNKDDSYRFYYKNGYKHNVYIDINGKETEHDPSTEPDLYTRMEGWDICINSGYASEFTSDNSGYYFMRCDKIIDRFAKPRPGKGDFKLQDVIGYSRHIIQFPPSLDHIIKIQLNKSHIKEGDLPLTLRKSIDEITTKYAKSMYNKLYKKTKERDEVPIVNVPPPPPVLVRQDAVVSRPATVAPPPVLMRQNALIAPPPVLVRQDAVVSRPATVAPPPGITRQNALIVPPPKPVPVAPVELAPRPPVHYEIQFDISSRKELILTDARTDTRITTLPTDGNGADLRGVLIGRLLKLADREKFIKECLPLMEQLMNM